MASETMIIDIVHVPLTISDLDAVAANISAQRQMLRPQQQGDHLENTLVTLDPLSLEGAIVCLY